MGFFSLEIGKKALQTSQVAMDITGHNISNANTEGYSRQNVNLEALVTQDPKYGTIGSSVDAVSISRARNTYLDDRMLKEQTEKSKWDARDVNLKHIEDIINEPSNQSIRYILDQFWKSVQDVSNNPEDRAVRVGVRERAADLASTINNTYEQLKTVKKDINDNMAVKISSINSSLKQIAELNVQITTLESNRKEANDLRDKRDLLIENLSKVVNVQVSRTDREFSVVVGGKTAVQGNIYKELKATSDAQVNDGMYQIKWTDTDENLYLTNGELKGLQEMRDVEINKYLDYIDQLAVSIVDRVNEVHQSGFDITGLQGGELFGNFETHTETLDIDKDTIQEAVIYKAKGSKTVSETENSTLNSQGVTSGAGHFEVNGIRINYDTSKDTMRNILDKINSSNTGVTASMDPYNRLTFRADKDDDYIIKSFEDTGGTFLQDMGILVTGKTKFDFQDSTTLSNITTDRVAKPKDGAAANIYVKLTDVDKIAAAKGKDTNGDGIPDTTKGPGDGSNALKLAGLRYEQAVGKYTYENYFASMVSDIGVTAQQADRFVKSQTTLIDNLEQRRQSEVGVSIDEEMTNMIKFQHSYNAASKYINTINQMMDTIINKL